MITRNYWLSSLGLPEVSDPDYNKRKNELESEQLEPINTGTDQNTNENNGGQSNEPAE
jgi:hypothetical protein